MSPARADAARILPLPRVLDLNAAAPLAAQLLAMRGVAAVIDGSHVERVGAQCLQVLLSALATWSADGALLEIVDLSQDFVDGLRLLGFSAGQLAQ